MIRNTLMLVLVLVTGKLFGQVKELEKLRKAVTLFMDYDNGKIDSLPKTSATTKKLQQAYEAAFMDFIQQPESKNLDNLQKNSINNKTSYIIGNNNYFFSTLRRDMLSKSLENNADYMVTFYPLYDYQLKNFVSFYIQPFFIGTKEYVVYYRKLNGKGTYYIKDVATNKMVFESEGLTSNAPIKKMVSLDAQHLLIIEDMGDNGERALVVNTKLTQWKPINAFYGKAFLPNATNYTQLTQLQKRTYFRIATTGSMMNNYGKNYLKQYAMRFDTTAATIQYRKFTNNESDVQIIKAKWQNNQFAIDDYYMGEAVKKNDVPVPM